MNKKFYRLFFINRNEQIFFNTCHININSKQVIHQMIVCIKDADNICTLDFWIDYYRNQYRLCYKLDLNV